MTEEQFEFDLPPEKLQEAKDAAKRLHDTLAQEDPLVGYVALGSAQIALMIASRFPRRAMNQLWKKQYGQKSPIKSWNDYTAGTLTMAVRIAQGMAPTE